MRFGIIGCGGMGRYQAQQIMSLPGHTIAALCDPAPSPAAHRLAGRLGLEVLPDAAALLALPDIDAVVITTPTDTHAPLAIAAAQAGKHIFCEKPLARTLAEAEAMLAAADRAGVRLAVGHVVRYFPEYARARAMVLAGEIGQPAVARTARLSAFPHSWFGDIARSGGVVVDMMIHDFDWLRWTLGPAVRVHALGLTHTHGASGRDAAMVVLRFASGAIGYAEGSWCYPSFQTAIEISGSGGLIRTDNRSTVTERLAAAPPEEAGEQWADGLVESPYRAQIREVAAWMAGGPAPRHTAADGVESLRIALAALESMRAGQPISLAQNG